MRVEDFNFDLPGELIAQHPNPQRDRSRLLVLGRPSGRLGHHHFHELPSFLREGDVLVLNDSKVMPARLSGVKSGTGAMMEILLLEEQRTNLWSCLLRPGKRVRQKKWIALLDRSGARADIRAHVMMKGDDGRCLLEFEGTADLKQELPRLGKVPLPHYIERASEGPTGDDSESYQTVYARSLGSVAAPTAGLHFTKALLDQVRQRGVGIESVTLHVGLGTFSPVRVESVEEHVMHEERFELTRSAADAINQARAAGGRIVAVGTTTLRVLESVGRFNDGKLAPATDRTRLFIYPPSQFRIVDALVTNFHLPCSTLLMLVSAFAAPNETRGRSLILAAYQEAIQLKYRFFSYGDAMLIM